MKKLPEKQQQLWDFFRQYFEENRKFPKFQETADNFGISTAAVSHRIGILLNKKRLSKLPIAGYVLLNEDEIIYCPDLEEFYLHSHLEPYIETPYDRICTPDMPLIFTLLRDFEEQFSLKYGDLIEVRPVSKRELKSGNLIVVQNRNIFKLNVYMYPLNLKERKGNIPDYIYNKYVPGNRIIGIVSGVYRSVNNGL